MSVPTISKSILTDRNSVYNEQSTIDIFISPEEVPLLNTSQGTYLKFLLKVNEDPTVTNCLCQPDPMAGGAAILSTISIFSGDNMALLEQLEDVSAWTAMDHHYSKTQGLANMRTLTEGVSPVVGRALTSQYFTWTGVDGITYKEVECVIPLNMSGLLQQGGRLLPVIALNGIRIRIQTNRKEVALRALTQVGYSSTGSTYTGIRQITGIPIAGSQDPQTFGNAVAVATATAITSISLNTVGIGVAPAPATNVIQALPTFQNCAYQVGQDLWVQQTAPAAPINLGTILTVTLTANGCTYTFASVTTTGAVAVDAKVWVDANSLKADYEMSNVEFVCSVVQASGQTMSGLMNQVSSGGGIRIDYPSFNLMRNNLQAGIPRSEILMPANEQRAMSIVSCPMRSTGQFYEDTLRPIGDSMDTYQWNIANRLVPNQRVSVKKVAERLAAQRLSWDSIHLHETEKAIGRCDIVPRNLCENARYFAVARELAKQGHSFDANMNEIRLNVAYGSAANENVINKLVSSWLYHIRTVVITPGSVAVEF